MRPTHESLVARQQADNATLSVSVDEVSIDADTANAEVIYTVTNAASEAADFWLNVTFTPQSGSDLYAQERNTEGTIGPGESTEVADTFDIFGWENGEQVDLTAVLSRGTQANSTFQEQVQPEITLTEGEDTLGNVLSVAIDSIDIDTDTANAEVNYTVTNEAFRVNMALETRLTSDAGSDITAQERTTTETITTDTVLYRDTFDLSGWSPGDEITVTAVVKANGNKNDEATVQENISSGDVFDPSNITITCPSLPSEVVLGEPFTVEVAVENRNDTAVTGVIDGSIDGRFNNNVEVSVPPKTTKTVTFPMTPIISSGEKEVTVEGFNWEPANVPPGGFRHAL
jgi:hypothetical protein